MILITTALPMEAKPLVASLGLKAESGEAFPVYRNEECVLVVTGVGALKASAATGWALGRLAEFHAAINVGFCGAAPEVCGLHEWIYVSSIRDQASGRLSIPDILFRHPFRELALLTVGKVVKSGIDWNGVVDMEGAGFFEAAGRFLAPDRLALIKWVSDPLTGSIHIEETSRAYAGAIEPVVDFIREWIRLPGTSTGAETRALYAQVESRLRLTRTQAHFVRKWADGYLARGGDPAGILEILPEAPPATKAANSRIFEELKNVFKN